MRPARSEASPIVASSFSGVSAHTRRSRSGHELVARPQDVYSLGAVGHW